MFTNLPAAVLILILAFGWSSLACGGTAPRLFWTDKDAGRLEVSDLDGSNRVPLLTGLADPRGIAVDAANNKIYWASHVASGAIFTADCDGNNVQTFLGFLPEPADIALDLANETIYWAEENMNRICRASLSSPVPEIVIDGLNRPYYLAIDPANGFLYWSDFNSTIIHRSTIDGASPVNFITGQSRVRDIELADGMIYWCDRNSSEIRRRAIDGTGGGTILFSAPTDSLDRPHGLVLDPSTGTMFWTDTVTDEVNMAAMDGSGSVTTLVGTGLTGAWAIAIAKPVLTPYQQWLPLYFSAAEIADPTKEATHWGELADPDLDGRLNLLEFGQGTSPVSSQHDPAAMQDSVVEESGERFFQLVYRIRKDDPALLAGIESSDLLTSASWVTGEFTEVPPRSDDPANPGYEFVTVRSGPIDELTPDLFARLRVSR